MAIPVGGPTQTQGYTQIQPDRVDGTGKDVTGSGMLGQAGSVPGTPTDPAYSAVMESIARLMPEIGGEMLDVMLLEITVKMKEAEEASQKDTIRVEQEAKRTALTEKKDKLEEALKKIEEAIDKEKNASIWDKIKMAFQALGAALMIAIGAILIATGAGAAAGVALIAIGVVCLIMVIDSAVKSETGLGIAGNLHKACNPDASEEELAKADMGFGIALAGAAIIGSVVAFFIPGNQVSAIATMAQSIGTLVNAGLGVMTAAGDVYAGVTRYQATENRADGQRLQADAKEMEALLQQLDEFIDQALSRLMATGDRFNAMLDSLTDAIQDRANSVQKAALRA